MRVVVQKFGGTSVASPESRDQVCQKIVSALDRGLAACVVISAMGRKPQPYATDSLLALLEQSPQPDRRELDMLMACGENIACVVMAQHLRDRGYSARALTGLQAGILTSGEHGEAAILSINPTRVRHLLQQGVIAVVAGFQGATAALETTTLGRGGSDTTAVALGAALKAEFVEIYTDVEGVLTADPRLYDQAQILPQLNFEEMGELAGEGAKVVHPRAVDLASEYGVPVWIKNTFSDGYGTFLSQVMPKDAFERTRVVTSVAHVTNLTQMVVELPLESLDRDRMRVLQALAEAQVNIDLSNACDERLYFIFRRDREEAARTAVEALKVRYRTRTGCAKLSVVGAGMRGTPGVLARVLKALVGSGVQVLHTTDSNITISCLVPEEQLSSAVRALHEEFGLSA